MTQDELLRLIDEAAADGRPTLDLSGQGLEVLPPEIKKLTNLKTLVLGRWDKENSEPLGNRLKTLPDELAALTELRSLFLPYNQFTELPEVVGSLGKLRSLNLSYNQLSTLPDVVGQLSNLRSLYLRKNQLSSLPESVGQLSNLRSLYLRKNQLSSLPESVGQLSNLRSLNLSSNQLSTLPESVGQFSNLRSLYLSSNQLSSLPESVGQFSNLRSLYLSDNQLSTLSDIVGQLSNLTSLNLWNNQLSSLPESIGQLTSLTSLDLSNNQLSTLPDIVGQLTSLTSLYLRYNQLSSLPESVGQLTSLTSLYLSNNQLSSLPESVGQLTSLTSLYLSNNQLSSLPESVGQLTSLTSLYLSNNQLSSLPESVGQLSSLTSLDLSNNQLSTLPESVGQLSSLTSLSLSNNQLGSLPESVGQLSSLTSLSLSNNQLSSLPESVGQLSRLASLDLWNNKISSLPDWVQKLFTLKTLDLRANRLPIPPEVLGGKHRYNKPAPAADVINYYFQEKSDTPLYEAKLIIVGEGGAGKTTLAKKLIDPNYELNKDEKSTEGIEVIPYEFDHPSGHRCKVNIWDFGGQEIYHATHQFFLSERAVYALVADSRKENTDFYFWLNAIQLHGGDSPVLLIKNEKQDRPCSVPDMQLRGQFKNLKDSLETNFASKRNLETVKTTLEQYISNLPHVGDPLPKTWAQVRSVLENQALGSDHYISIQDYRQICTAQGIPTRNEQDRLSRFLHQLGVFLHFQDIDQLAKTIFLTPAWSTDAVYKVLDTPKVRKNCGRFNQADLQEIWSDHQYADVRGELLALMQEFEVAYEIIGRKQHYIAPHLLEANLPQEHQYRWDEQDNLILSYYYPFKPKNIFPRFIVALHRYIENQILVWKHGVVLSIGSARAEVIEDVRYEAAHIRIRICGTDKKRLLSIIGHELERIHSSFNNLNYETRIPCNCPECKPSQTPYQFAYPVLQKSLSKRNLEVQCQKSFEMVNVRHLIDDVIEPSFDRSPDRSPNRSPDRSSDHSDASIAFASTHQSPYKAPAPQNSPFSNKVEIAVNFPAQQYQEQTTDMSTTINQFGQGDNIAGDKIGRDKIETQINAPAPLTPAPSSLQSSLDIFISYAREDGNPAAERLRQEMTSAGFAVWRDIENMQGGQEWKVQLRTALRQVKAVVLLLTPKAVASKYVEWELEMARMAETTILPVLIQDCDIPDELDRLHYRNLSSEHSYPTELLLLIKDLNQLG